MYLYSDNTGPAHPDVMAALTVANQGYQQSYGDDALMEQVRDEIRTQFEAPKAAVYLVATGTAANALALSTLAQPWQTIFCTPMAHIQVDECHAPEFYTGGSKLTLVGPDDKMTPTQLEAAIAGWEKGDVHVSQHGPLALTNVTERGRLYNLDEIRALTKIAKTHGISTHLDGARFANAVAALGCTPAQMSWKAGIDALSFGGTKNGCLGVEAVIFFDPKHAWEFELRRKRGAHLFSKHRYLSAQMLGYLQDGRWQQIAHQANENAAHLIAGLKTLPDASFSYEPQANMIFATLPRATHQKLKQAGAQYGLFEGPLNEGPDDEPLMMRCVCDWSIHKEQIDRFIDLAST